MFRIFWEVYYNGLTAHYRSEVVLKKGWHWLALQRPIEQLSQSTEVALRGAGITLYEVRDSTRVTDLSLQDAMDRANAEYHEKSTFKHPYIQKMNRWTTLIKVLTSPQEELAGERVPRSYQQRLKSLLATAETQSKALKHSLKMVQPSSRDAPAPLQYGNEVRILIHVEKASPVVIDWKVYTKSVSWKPVYDLSHEGMKGPVVWRTNIQVSHHRLWDLFEHKPLTLSHWPMPFDQTSPRNVVQLAVQEDTLRLSNGTQNRCRGRLRLS